MRIQYVVGDATRPPEALKPAVIVHVCNDQGRWGKGFVLAVSKRWSAPRQAYLRAFREGEARLGTVQFVKVEENLWVANMVAQKGLGRGAQRIQYEHLETCLLEVARWIADRPMTVHMPRIGCGLGGGTWGMIEPFVDGLLASPTYVYDLP